MNDFTDRFGDVPRGLSGAGTLEETMEYAVQAATHLIAGCECAEISVVQGKKTFTTVAATSDAVRQSVDLQRDLDEGPILDALGDTEMIYVADLSSDERWPRWGPKTYDLELRSMIGIQLYVGRRTYGTMGFYSENVDGFSPIDRDDAFGFASQVSAAIASVKQTESLEAALANRLVIGQAQGRLMQRYGVTADQAFAVLARTSQDANRKLVEICRDIVTRGPETLNGV
ncbi:GAF and ANTAR domain-containing protein [Aeromicrobium alkaliterrae]|uniref:GAF and ANTAR domain-containing protein n=1 Tax=Aeromicrobium alkaliterrae TaxID=302168 RepID=A0ABN2JVF7_9ACTN